MALPPKPKIDRRVEMRIQKDMDGFIELYQQILDRRAAQYAAAVYPTWERFEKYAILAIQRFYRKHADKNGQLNEAQITELERLLLIRELIQVMQADTKNQEKQLRNTLAYTYFESYHFSAFALEQTAAVAVAVPVLSHSQVMGVLANPWLPDGNTYSDRLRANTAFLAAKMQEAVEEAISTGADVYSTARNIQDIAGEGYFNAVRLARTELNRAANQGATHLYMQNADILDGKRWNATLDSRTAPKDAANDGKIYPLEYDTPEMPGRPGERIPNHPNCRCKYSPVISALGVRRRQRIARGDGDTPSNFGERIYTNAATYREYAKERGLPDLDERLANDDPRRYLRRGETLE